MKKAFEIIDSLQNKPQFGKLNSHKCIKRVIKLFPLHLQEMVLFGYVNKNIITFVLSHPGAKQEFNTIIESIKTPLKLYPPDVCEGIDFDEIKAYVDFNFHKKEFFTYKEPPRYEERSHAKFKNSIKNDKNYNILENIRDIIEND